MGWGLAEALKALAPRSQSRIPISVPSWQQDRSLGRADDYQAHARAFTSNEIVFAAVRLRAQSAAEPAFVGRRWRRDRPTFASNRHAGHVQRARNVFLVQNGYVEELPQHPLVKIMNNPNPFTTRARLMRMLVMDRDLDGNCYIAKVRSDLGNVVELWRLRPDRVRIIPDRQNFIAGYTYTVGNETALFPPEDIIHWDEPNPLSDYYGFSPVSPIMARVEVDNALRQALGDFYTGGGAGPGAILTLSGKLDDTIREQVRDKLRKMLNHIGSFRETLILEQGTSDYKRLGLDRGLTDYVPKEVNAVMESRIGLPFGIPGSILGLLIGYESSSYANKRADWQVFWDITMTPLMADFDDGFTRSLCPEFGGIDELLADLSDIRALQEDIDALHERARKNVDAALWTIEEGRGATGVTEVPQDGDHMLLPTRSTLVPVPLEDLIPEHPVSVPAAPPAMPEPSPANALAAYFRASLPAAPLQLPAPRRGRPRLENDAEALATWERCESLRTRHPGMTVEQVAARVGISVSTYHRHRRSFARE